MNPARVALEETWASLRVWLGDLPAETYGRPSVLDGWTVRDLVSHLGLAIEVLEQFEPALSGSPAITVGEYVRSYPSVARPIAMATRRRAESAEDPLAVLDASWARATASVDAPSGAGDPDAVVMVKRGRVRLSDLLITRLIELVVHGDDLARSVPEVAPPEFPREGKRLVVRALVDAMVERAPGRSVELRVPPYAAAQCIEGPRHTRGTPPNVVEADPMTWVRLASGRVTWGRRWPAEPYTRVASAPTSRPTSPSSDSPSPHFTRDTPSSRVKWRHFTREKCAAEHGVSDARTACRA